MDVGIIGLPSSGKTTLLNALTHAHAETGSFGASSQPNLGVVRIPDPRLSRIVELVEPQRVVQAELSFIDIPGQPPEMGKSRGIQGQYLLEVSQADALLLVIRAFQSPALPVPTPEADLETMLMEMVFADLAIVSRRLERITDSLKSARASERDGLSAEMHLLDRLRAALEGGDAIRSVEMTPDEARIISGFTFLTTKPLIIALNISESDLSRSAELSREWNAAHGNSTTGCIAFSARLEEELSQLDPAEGASFREEMGAPPDAIGELARLAQSVAGLITFYTAGPQEARAWQLEADTTAPRAAGKKIHTDMERGFIRAEVTSYDDFLAVDGKFPEARRRGVLRQEGKTYLIQDGDVVTFLFNVSPR